MGVDAGFLGWNGKNVDVRELFASRLKRRRNRDVAQVCIKGKEDYEHGNQELDNLSELAPERACSMHHSIVLELFADIKIAQGNVQYTSSSLMRSCLQPQLLKQRGRLIATLPCLEKREPLTSLAARWLLVMARRFK